MSINITRTQIDRVKFFSNLESFQSDLSKEFMDILNDLIDSFKTEMSKPTMNGEQLLEVWESILSFSKFDFSINNFSNTNKIEDVLGEVVDTKGFLIMVDFINNRAIENDGGYYGIAVRNIYCFFKYSKNETQAIYLYKGYFETMNVKLGFAMKDADSILLASKNEDFLLKHYDDIFPKFRVDEKYRLFSKNVFNILNKSKIFKSNNGVFRTNECARAILKNTDDNSIYLNNKQFSKLISLYLIYGESVETISELIRVIDLEEIKKRLIRNNTLVRNKEICLNSKENIFAVENLLGVKIENENLINEDGIVLVNFDFQDQLWLIDLVRHDLDKVKELMSFVKDNNLYVNKNNKLTLNKDNKDILELNFKY